MASVTGMNPRAEAEAARIVQLTERGKPHHCESFGCYYFFIIIFLLLAFFISMLFFIGMGIVMILMPIHICHQEEEWRKRMDLRYEALRTLEQKKDGAADLEAGNGDYTGTKNKNVRSVIAVVNKAKADQKLGIKVQKTNGGRFLVASLSPESPFRQTELREGMEIKTINAVEVKGHDLNSVMTILRNCIGSIIVVAETNDEGLACSKKSRTLEVVVNKATADQKLGIKVQHTLGGRYLVGTLSPESPFRQTALKEGMEIKSINGVAVKDFDMQSVMTILRDCVGRIVVVAETTDSVPHAAVQTSTPLVSKTPEENPTSIVEADSEHEC